MCALTEKCLKTNMSAHLVLIGRMPTRMQGLANISDISSARLGNWRRSQDQCDSNTASPACDTRLLERGATDKNVIAEDHVGLKRSLAQNAHTRLLLTSPLMSISIYALRII